MLSRALVSGRCLLLPRHAALARGWQRAPAHHFSGLSQRRQTARHLPLAALEPAAPTSEESPSEGAPAAPCPGFKALGVDERLLGPLESQGISVPTDVQRAAVPEVLSGANVAVQSYTGSGKTLAYLLPVMTLAIQRAEDEWSKVTRKTAGNAGTLQAVVVAPSRELAMQILRVAQTLLPESAKRSVQQAIGGANIMRQREALKLYKPILVVGTPGRIAELSRDGALQTHRCGILVLDEVDQLLAPHFREEMQRITEHCGRKAEAGRQTILVSATLTPKVLLHCQPWCPAPRKVFVGTAASALVAAADHITEEQTAAAMRPPGTGSTRPAEGAGASGGVGAAGAKPSWGWGRPGATSVSDAVDFPASTGTAGGYFTGGDVRHSMPPHLEHLVVSSAPQHKVDMMRRAIHAMGIERALVFMNFQQRLQDTQAKLAARGMEVGRLHGEMTKQERQRVMQAFRDGELRALIVSDVAARGLDIPECDAVFHLELPTDPAHYAHRAGRTGRAGRPGVVVSVVSGGERYVVDKLARQLGVPVREVELSHGQALEVPEEEQQQRQQKRQQGERGGRSPEARGRRGPAGDEARGRKGPVAEERGRKGGAEGGRARKGRPPSSQSSTAASA